MLDHICHKHNPIAKFIVMQRHTLQPHVFHRGANVGEVVQPKLSASPHTSAKSNAASLTCMVQMQRA